MRKLRVIFFLIMSCSIWKKCIYSPCLTALVFTTSMVGKVHIFWEGHKILRNLHLTFDHSTLYTVKMICQVGLLLFKNQNALWDFSTFIAWISWNQWIAPKDLPLLFFFAPKDLLCYFFTCHPRFHVKNIHWGIFCYHIQGLCTL